jgi:spore coat polysaccharide biosynthesis protein SpsF
MASGGQPRDAVIVAIIDAGLSRPRSPELMMAPILGEPFIWRVVERVRRARTLTKIVIATSRDPRDDALCGYLTARGQSVYRGDREDLAGAFLECAQGAGGARYVACVRAETPLIDPGVIDEAVRYANASRAPLVTNAGHASYPKGLEVEVIAASMLGLAAGQAEGDERSDPALFVRNRADLYDVAEFSAGRDWSGFDWTIRTAEAFAFARSVFEALYRFDPAFGVEETIDYLQRRPDLVGTAAA